MADTKAIALDRRLDFIGLDAKARAALVDARPVVERPLPAAIAPFYQQPDRPDSTPRAYGCPAPPAHPQPRSLRLG